MKRMKRGQGELAQGSDRRSFLKHGMLAAGAATALGAGLAPGRLSAAFDVESAGSPGVTRGDIAILKFLQALEAIEADLWIQYSELGGTQDSEISGVNGGNDLYTAAIKILDGDMDQYIHDNTDDEITHAAFLSKYLASLGAGTPNLEPFRHLPSSKAAGANQSYRGDGGRLTNLTQLTIDTSWWSRYRSLVNPEIDHGVTFAQAVPDLAVGKHTAIPRTDADTAGSTISPDPNNNPQTITQHLQAIAFTAGFHFAAIEVGGTSLYPTLAQKVTNPEVLRVLLAIGPTEAMHFQTWQDKAGNVLPVSDTDTGFPGSTGASLSFQDLKGAQGETSPESLKGDVLQANLIMPEPTHFLNAKRFPPVSVVRPTSTKSFGAMAALNGLISMGLFIGHTVNGKSDGFVELLKKLAIQADDAQRESGS